MKKKRIALLCVALCMLSACAPKARIVPIDSLSPSRSPKPIVTQEPTPTPAPVMRVDENAATIAGRYAANIGYTRQQVEAGSFSAFLQTLPLKEAGTEVAMYEEGETRDEDDYAAVIDLPAISKNELGAGAIAHLRAQYFYSMQDYAKISFTLNDGFYFGFEKWRGGERLEFPDGDPEWTSGGTASDSEDNFHDYLSTYFVYSGMRSLVDEDLSEVDAEDEVRIGDVFVTDGDPERAVIVVDSAVNADGARQVLLAEGGRPAQQMRLLDNPFDSAASPWFQVDVENSSIKIDEDTTLLAATEDGDLMRYKFLISAS